MASVINTNVASLNAQRNLVNSQNALSTSIQRLSSGLRINSAKDDSAGLAISERFSSQIRGLNQAARNANDAISLTQTAEGAMSTISDGLQRIRELAVQSANATNSQSDRDAMQKEVAALVAEIDRVAAGTDFNGTKLLDGSYSGQQMQIGANAGQTIGIKGILNAKTSALGETSFKTAKITVTGAADTTDTSTKGMDAATFKLNGIDIEVAAVAKTGSHAAGGTAAAAADKAANAAAIAAAINAKSSQHNVIAEIDSTNNIVLTQSVGDKAITSDIAAAAGSFAVSDDAKETAAKFDISSFAGAQKAMQIADNALKAVNDARADMGAIQNRFSSVISNLQSSTENLSASQSRIRDTDYASETAKLTRNQILQQAGTAMLAQANSLPNSVLSLLG